MTQLWCDVIPSSDLQLLMEMKHSIKFEVTEHVPHLTAQSVHKLMSQLGSCLLVEAFCIDNQL